MLARILLIGSLGFVFGACQADEVDYDFTVVALPDTQHYSETYPHIYTAQMKWIADNRDDKRIVFVTHLGDIVNRGDDPDQWAIARGATDLLDQAQVPYGTCLGNHDLMAASYGGPSGDLLTTEGCSREGPHDDCIGQLYLENFGPQRYQDRPWFGGSSPTGLSNYQGIDIGGVEVLFLHLAVDPDAGERTWAQSILDQHPRAAVHLSTHRYLLELRTDESMPEPLPRLAGGRYDDFLSVIDPTLFGSSITAEALFTEFIAVNPNIFMVQCGHVDSEYRQVSTNQAGLPVHEILTDFQEFSPRGGDGWLRLLHFHLDRAQVRVRTYSPTLKRYRENGEGFDASLEMIQWAITDYRDVVALFTDIQAVEEMVDRFANTEEGRKEYYRRLYARGARDSDFILDLDLSAYAGD